MRSLIFAYLLCILPCLCIAQNSKGDKPIISDQDVPLKDQLIADDLIVQSSECVGIDCVNGETFGFDIQRYKENNLRVHFDDTSNSASFPSNDWRIVINDSGNSGDNYFAVEDATAGMIPFRLDAGAPTHSLYMANNGDIGLGTFTPVIDLHITDGNTPGIRIEQDGTGGYTPQIFDIRVNETHFVIKDVTGGNLQSFQILPGAPDDGLVVAPLGVGINTNAPVCALDVIGDVSVSGSIMDMSDARLKVNISSIVHAMDLINALDGKSYIFDKASFPNSSLPDGKQFGLLAQDVEKVMAELVKDNYRSIEDATGKEESYKALDYQGLIPVLVNALKEQDEKISNFEAKQLEMEKQLNEMAELLKELKK